jgi:hypothetical protein
VQEERLEEKGEIPVRCKKDQNDSHVKIGFDSRNVLSAIKGWFYVRQACFGFVTE